MRAISIFFALLCFLDLMREPQKKLPPLSTYLASLPADDRWEVLDQTDLTLTCGSSRKIALKRVCDDFIYNVTPNNFFRGTRPPKRLQSLGQYLESLAHRDNNDAWECVNAPDNNLSIGVSKKVVLRRMRDAYIHEIQVNNFISGNRPPKRGLLSSHLEALPETDKWTFVDPNDAKLSAMSGKTIILRRASDGFLYRVQVSHFTSHGTRPEEYIMTLGEYLSSRDADDQWTVPEEYLNRGFKANETIVFCRVSDNYLYKAKICNFTAGTRPAGSHKAEMIVREYLNTVCDARFVSEARNFHSVVNKTLRGTQFCKMIIKRRQLDFLFLGLRLGLEIQGEQHYEDMPRFETFAIDQVENDFEKAVLLHNHGFSVIYLSTQTIRGAFDWRPVLCTTISHAVHDVLEPSVFFLRTNVYKKHKILLDRFEADDSPYQGNVFEVFISRSNNMDVVNVSTKACVTVRKLDKITVSGVLAKAEIEEV